jgi:ABC-2 type transport system permease protein
MSAVFAVLLKDLKVRFSTPIELAFFLILPLLFTVVLSGTPSGKTEARENRPLVLIADGVRSTSSGRLATALVSLPGIRARVTNDPAELLRSSEADLLLWIIPSSEGQAPFHVAFKPSPWHGVSPAVQRLGALLSTADPLSEDAMRQWLAAEPASAPQTVESADPSDRAVTGNAGQIVTWVLVPLLGMGSIFISERRRGTLRRAVASPAGRPALTAGTVAAEFAAAAVQIALLLLFSSLIYGLPAGSHPLELALLSLAFCAAGAALGAVLGLVCRTERQAGAMSISAAMILAVFGGCWYPSSLFPAGLKKAPAFNPAGWAMDGFTSLLSPAGSGGGALHDALKLSLFALALLFIVLAASRLRRDNTA